MALKAIYLSRSTKRHGDVIDVCEELANGDYGSARNALIAVVKQSPLFRKTLQRLHRKNEPARQSA
jgi:hypothetical protein